MGKLGINLRMIFSNLWFISQFGANVLTAFVDASN